MKPEKLSKEVVDLLLPRLKDEYTAFYFYNAAANYCKNVGYFKAAEFFSKESKDELEHAKGLENYIIDWNVTPILPVIEKPQVNFSGLYEILEKAYKLEYDLYEAYEETSEKLFKMDLCVFDFLQKYRIKQNESVAEYSDKLNILEGVAEDKFKLLLLQDQLFS